MGMKERKQIIRKMNYERAKKYSRKLLLIIFLVATFIALFGITSYLNISYRTPRISDSMTYNQKGNVDYEVCLKQNDFLGTNCIKKSSNETSYVSTLIDSLKFYLTYQLDASDLADYTYSYNITATTSANEKGDTSKILYNKQEVLKQGSYDYNNTNLITFSDDVGVDYQLYNNLIKDFKKSYVLSLDSNLVITFNMSIYGHKNGIKQEINETHSATAIIPLAEQTTNITFNDDKTLTKGNTITQEINTNNQFNFTKLALDIVYGIDAVYLLYVIILGIKMHPNQKTYNGKIAHILRNYNAYIVRSVELPPIEEMKIIEIQTFDDLLDVRNNIQKPIIFYEGKHKDYSVFTIMAEQVAYVYVLYQGDIK